MDGSKKKQKNSRNPQKTKSEKSPKFAQKPNSSASQTASEFLVGMSHKIRTPMNAIIGFCQVLAEQDLTEEQQGYVEIIHESTRNLLDLINDILEFSKLQTGEISPEISDCSLAQLLALTASSMRPDAATKKLDLQVRQAENLPPHMRTDPVRIHQCLTNLVRSAIRLSKAGQICLNASLEQSNGKPYVRFDIETNNTDIPPSDVETIFQPFTELNNGAVSKAGGTGLELAIAKQLALLLGGELSVTNNKGKALTFTFRIPLGVDMSSEAVLDNRQLEEDKGPQSAPVQSGKETKFFGRVLVAEDNRTNQALIDILLKQMGTEVTKAEDGKEAVDKALSEPFDLIFMDIEMPNMNGYEATKTLRQKGLTTPIVALTAHVMNGDEQKCLSVGCDDYLAKPLDRQKLLQVMRKYLHEDSEALEGQIDTVESQIDELNELYSEGDAGEGRQAAPTESEHIEEVIDWPALIEMCSDENVVREITKMFLKDSPRCMDSITEAIQAGNPKYVGMYAHSLKGAALQIGAKRLSEEAHKLEQAGKEKDVGAIPPLFEQVRAEYQKVVSFLSRTDWIDIAKQQSTVKEGAQP